MPQPNDLSRSLVALDQNSTVIGVVELSQSSWLVAEVLPGIGKRSRVLFLNNNLAVHPRVRRTNIIIDARFGKGDRL